MPSVHFGSKVSVLFCPFENKEIDILAFNRDTWDRQPY